MENPLPRRHGSEFGAVLVDLVPRQLTTARVDVDLVNLQPAGTLPEEATDPEENNDWESKVRFEEALNRVVSSSDWADGDEKLSRVHS